MLKTIYRTFRTAIHALRRNVMRSALTCLGIIIGIAAVIAMVEIGQGSSHAIQQTIANMGVNQVGIEPAVIEEGIAFGGGADTDDLAARCAYRPQMLVDSEFHFPHALHERGVGGE